MNIMLYESEMNAVKKKSKAKFAAVRGLYVVDDQTEVKKL